MISDNEVKKWFKELPFVTRIHLIVALVLSVATTVGILPAEMLCLPRSFWECLQVWRFPLSCLFHGPLGLGLLLHGYFCVQSSRQIESLMFSDDPYCFLWVLMASCLVLIPPCLLLGVSFPSDCVTPLLVFIACRSRPTATMQFLFGITVQALYFPLVLLAFRFLSGGSLVTTLLGMCAGHAYVYHQVLKPKERTADAFLPFTSLYERPTWLRQVETQHRRALLGTGPLPATWAN